MFKQFDNEKIADMVFLPEDLVRIQEYSQIGTMKYKKELHPT